MKELHHHIFSNTTCISKETMLKHINKQLSKEELHQVETHMLDCDLCTDAYAGMAYAENSSMLFAIDNQIDNRAGVGVSKTPIMRNLMLAASVLVIVFGTYFTLTFFNETINNEGNLALNEVVQKNETEEIERVKLDKIEADNLAETEQEHELKKEVEAVEGEIIKPVLVEEIVEYEMEEVIAEMNVLEDLATYSEPELIEHIIPEPITNSSNEKPIINNFSTNKINDDEEFGLEIYEEETTNSEGKLKLNQNRERSQAKKTVALSSAYSSNVVEPAKSLKNKDQKTMVIADYKLVNYLDEYQESYEAEKRMTPKLESVSAGYENKQDKKVAQQQIDEVTIEVTYKVTLERAIYLYKIHKYIKALNEFEMISAKHPDEVNAQFYSGLCFYHLGQNVNAINKFDAVLKNKETEFNEETNWYKALTLLKLKNITDAKKVLKSIVQENGFYKTKAEEQLKGL